MLFVMSIGSVWAENQTLNLDASEATYINAGNPDTNYSSAEELYANYSKVSGGKLTDQLSAYGGSDITIIKFDASGLPAGVTVISANVTFNSACTVSGKNSQLAIVPINTSWSAATATWSNVDLSANGTNVVNLAYSANSTTAQTYDAKNVLIADDDKILSFAIFTNTGRQQKVSDFKLSIVYTEDPVEAAKFVAISNLPEGDASIFTPSVTEVEAAKAAINAATTEAEVDAAVAAATFTIPALTGLYTIYNTTAENYLGEVKLSADRTYARFEQAAGGFYINVNGKYINMKGGDTWSMNATAEASTVWNFTLTDGKYTINGPNGLIGADNTAAGSSTYGNKNVSKNGYWTIAPAASYERATATGAYGTICLPYAFTATGATIYSASVSGDEVVLAEVTTPVAGTPYIYQATANAQTFEYTSGALATAVAAEPLTGAFYATEVPVGSYVLQTNGADQKFYIVADGKQPTLSANKAYLTVSSSARELNIAEEATAIKAVNALVNGDAKIYDINGRELNSLQKGINIVNGVKVLVK